MKIGLSLLKEIKMIKECGIYYTSNDFYNVIRTLGGDCGNLGRRPVVCLVKSAEHLDLYWAIPMGIVGHRNQTALDRINTFLALTDDDIRSCYYHIGRTTNRSIFFISDAFPIIEKYIEEEHLDINKNHYIIKNKPLIAELERKLFRILTYENAKPNHFRQHITDIKKYLIDEIVPPTAIKK